VVPVLAVEQVAVAVVEQAVELVADDNVAIYATPSQSTTPSPPLYLMLLLHPTQRKLTSASDIPPFFKIVPLILYHTYILLVKRDKNLYF
jgi:hypothetical protein